nr:hypothetical protein [Tanacetum cinerariifolium]
MDLTQDDTKTLSPKHQLSSPGAPNAPSKTPLTKDTSSSSIDYTRKSPTSSTSPSTNGYLNSPTSPPPRVPPPPPTQENVSMDITFTLSPITSLDAWLRSTVKGRMCENQLEVRNIVRVWVVVVPTGREPSYGRPDGERAKLWSSLRGESQVVVIPTGREPGFFR